MAALHHEIWIDAPRERVYEALSVATKMSKWWDEQTEVTMEGGVVWEHDPFPEHGTVQFKILERTPPETVKFEQVSTHDEGVPGHGWTGSVMTFTLKERRDHKTTCDAWTKDMPIQTVVVFTHERWPDEDRYLAFCNTSWAQVLMQLKKFCEG